MRESEQRDTELDQEQPFVSHLLELRDRLLRAIVGVVAVLICLLPFANRIYTALAGPLLRHLPENATMIAIDVASPFFTPVKLTLVLAIFVAMPWILYQIWGFVAPGLYRHERRLVLPLLVSSTLLFYLGMAFAYFVVFPILFAFLSATAPVGVAMMTDISRYLDFVLAIFFAFGVAFEVPVATILLVWIGITTPENLVKKRPYVIVLAFVIGMFLTPPDAISQTLLAVPMWLLFELGVWLSRFYYRGEGGSEEPAVAPVGAGVAAPGPAGGDPPPFRALDEDEMEAELDRIEAEELSVHDRSLDEAERLLGQGQRARARTLLDAVLRDGTEVQKQRARELLERCDESLP